MDRESRELTARHSQSWPPGLFVGSLAFEADARSRRRRDGMTLVCLAVCAWSFGYGLTNWFCDSSERSLAVDASHAARATASHRQQDAHELANAAQAHRDLAHDLDSEASQHVVAPALADSKRTSAPKPRARATQPKPAAVLAEPTPLVTPEEAERELAIAAVSKRVFASVDESRALSMPHTLSVRAPQPSMAQERATPPPGRAAGQRNEQPPEPHAASELAEPAQRQRVASPLSQFSALELRGQVASEHPARARVASESRAQAPREKAAGLPLAAAGVGKVVAIEALHVEGGLPSTVVSRGVQRLLPHYDRCSQLCDKDLQRLKLSTQIDEAGHGRRVTVEGLSQPSLRRCLEEATAHLVVRAPDTGTARARWIVRFAQR